MPALSLVTLGVADVPAATAFYERLGWRRSSASVEGEVSFLHGPTVLGLWGRAALAEDAKLPQPTGAPAIALAVNVPERDDVDARLAAAVEAGATLQKPAEDTPWGGRAGYFRDPDGHLWEVAWNPHWPLRADGSVELPP